MRSDVTRGKDLRRLVAALALAVAPAMALAEEPSAEGEILFGLAGCGNCHTAKGGEPLAGGDPIVTPFGTFVPPNITPDPEHGIGGWTDEDFLRAAREGIAPDGSPYYPAFPFTSYSRMTDADLLAIKDYIFTLEPVAKDAPPHDLGFPFNIRTGLWAWRWLFFDPRPFEPDPALGESANRGAYLVEGPGHCAECHTPRNMFGARDDSLAYAGSTDGPGGEAIPNITPSPDGIGDWSKDDLLLFFELGMMPDGDFAGGEMAKVIENGTSILSDADREAIADYLMSLAPH